jgi:Transposase, Mutator family
MKPVHSLVVDYPARLAQELGTLSAASQRDLQTKAGEVRLMLPKLRRRTFETDIIERYRPRKSSVEEIWPGVGGTAVMLKAIHASEDIAAARTLRRRARRPPE